MSDLRYALRTIAKRSARRVELRNPISYAAVIVVIATAAIVAT